MKHTISDHAYAIALRGSAEPADIKWLHRHLRGESQPQLPGIKVGGKWRATEEMVDEAIELLTPKRTVVPQVPAASSMTRTSRRRLSA